MKHWKYHNLFQTQYLESRSKISPRKAFALRCSSRQVMVRNGRKQKLFRYRDTLSRFVLDCANKNTSSRFRDATSQNKRCVSEHKQRHQLKV